MKIKLDDKGNAVLSGGMPVFVDDDGRETAVDVAALMTSAKEHKSAARQRERELAEATAKLEAASKGGANDAERIKAAYEAQLAELKGKAEAAEAARAKALVDAALKGSVFLEKRVHESAQPLVAPAYRHHLAVDGERIVVKDQRGQVILSRANPLEPASVDEGLELLISQSPHADRILRGTQLPGSGAAASGGGAAGGLRLTRQQFDAMTPKERAASMQSGAQITD